MNMVKFIVINYSQGWSRECYNKIYGILFEKHSGLDSNIIIIIIIIYYGKCYFESITCQTTCVITV